MTLFWLGCCEILNQIFYPTWKWSTLFIMFTCECHRQEMCTLWPVNMRMHNCITNMLPTLNFTQHMSGTYTSRWNSTILEIDTIIIARSIWNIMLFNSIVIYHQYLIYTLNIYVFLHLTSIIPVSWPLAKTLPFGQNLQALTGPYISPLSLSLEGTSYTIFRVVLLIIVTWLKLK